jgi:hypothetical protein
MLRVPAAEGKALGMTIYDVFVLLGERPLDVHLKIQTIGPRKRTPQNGSIAGSSTAKR